MRLLKKFENEVILFSRDSEEIKNSSFSKKIVFLTNLFWSRNSYLTIKQLIRRQKPEIAHGHNLFPLISPSVLYALKEYDIPVVMTLHNYRLLCLNGVFLKNNGRLCEDCKKGNFFFWDMEYVLP